MSVMGRPTTWGWWDAYSNYQSQKVAKSLTG